MALGHLLRRLRPRYATSGPNALAALELELSDRRSPARLLALQWVETLNKPLSETDPELFDIMECLADVLSDGTESADAFVEEAFEEARKRER